MKDWIPLLAAVVAGLVAFTGYLINQRNLRQERRAQDFAGAIMWVKELEELPYRIAKRRATDPETVEKFGNLLNDIFVKISYYQAWMRITSPSVSRAYNNYSRRATRVSEEYIQQAWSELPVNDAGHKFYYNSKEELELCIRAMRSDLAIFSWDRTLKSDIVQLEKKRKSAGESTGPLAHELRGKG